jgi:hypothetical protein
VKRTNQFVKRLELEKANIAPGFLFHRPHKMISNLIDMIKYKQLPYFNVDTSDGINH